MSQENWLDKILAFKKTCEAGARMTEAQARVLRGTLYRYEALRKSRECAGWSHAEAFHADEDMIENNVLQDSLGDDPDIVRLEDLQREMAEVTARLKAKGK